MLIASEFNSSDILPSSPTAGVSIGLPLTSPKKTISGVDTGNRVDGSSVTS
eukprot:TRINITY_DN5361_c0_g2_i1.p5 TRINITY_DN5361_c0_g2~~TRINITY_DN5361_c0_g2_i1.p5  ORF type:complete len:51 (-),score=9.22 TRINITY_DN5361_c0_g2_i1:28-180(-)